MILSDHGSQFTSDKWYDTLRENNIKPIHSSIRHPESNPSERVMRELGRLFRAFCHDKHTSWANMVKQVEWWLCTVTHDSTGFTPNQLHYGVPPDRGIGKVIPFPPDVTSQSHTTIIRLANERLLSRAARRKQRHDDAGDSTQYYPEDLVLLKSHHQSSAENKVIKKFFLLYDGPFRVERKVGPNAYEITTTGPIQSRIIKGTFNVTNLRPYSVV